MSMSQPIRKLQTSIHSGTVELLSKWVGGLTNDSNWVGGGGTEDTFFSVTLYNLKKWGRGPEAQYHFCAKQK